MVPTADQDARLEAVSRILAEAIVRARWRRFRAARRPRNSARKRLDLAATESLHVSETSRDRESS